MLNNGSKFFIGLTALSAVSFGVYMLLIHPSALGATALFGLVAATAFLATMVVFTRDGDTELGDSSVLSEQPTASMWPLVGAAGAALLLVGTITTPIVTLFGIIFLLATFVEWAVQTWSERASSDSAYNATLRKRLMNPLEFPVLAAVGLGVIIFSFSRIMLAISKSAGAVVFMVVASLVLLAGSWFALRPALKGALVSAICVVGAVGIVAGGIAGAGVGLRTDLAEAAEEGHYLHRECGVEKSKYFDKKAMKTLSLRSNVTAIIELRNGQLSAAMVGFNEPQQRVTASRANPVTFIFRNFDAAERRMVASLGSAMPAGMAAPEATEGDGHAEKNETCTQLIPQGAEQALTVKYDKPSVAQDAPLTLTVPGVAGQSIEVFVP